MYRIIVALCLWSISVSRLLAADGVEFDIVEAAGWVSDIPAFEFADDASGSDSNGVHLRLLDEQYNAQVPGDLQYFKALEYTLTNRFAVENYSSIEISWYPGYEKLEMNELLLWRDGKIIEKIGTARFDILRLEPDRDNLIYDGARTLAIVLDDVRVGDTIRYSFTLTGENPVFNGLREFEIYTGLYRATDRHHARVISSASQPLMIRTVGEKVDMKKSNFGEIDEWVIDRLNVPEMLQEENVPSWRAERGAVVFSDIDSWESVVKWALPMYTREQSAPEELVALAAEIHQNYPADSDRIAAALRWVQDEIRYFGVEIDRSTHLPALPAVTLKKRFGDCKDKAVLLISLLGELGIDAYPALVNSNRTLLSDTLPFRLHAFDHVIVQVPHQGKAHFIDPTLSYQAGTIGKLYEPDYGKALLLREGEASLVSMDTRLSGRSKHVQKHFTVEAYENDPDVSSSSVSFAVTTKMQGRLAHDVRYALDTKGLSTISDGYREYYEDYFEDLSVVSKLKIDDGGEGLMTLNESYVIEDFWLSDDEFERYRWLYADEINSFLDVPENTRNRQRPYELAYPVDIEEKWTLELPQKHWFDDSDVKIENAWYRFVKKVSMRENGKVIEVGFHYETLVREVPAQDLEAYAKSVEELEDYMSFYLEDIEPEFALFSKLSAMGKPFWRVVVVGFIAFYLLVALLGLLWNVNHSRRFGSL